MTASAAASTSHSDIAARTPLTTGNAAPVAANRDERYDQQPPRPQQRARDVRLDDTGGCRRARGAAAPDRAAPPRRHAGAECLAGRGHRFLAGIGHRAGAGTDRRRAHRGRRAADAGAGHAGAGDRHRQRPDDDDRAGDAPAGYRLADVQHRRGPYGDLPPARRRLDRGKPRAGQQPVGDLRQPAGQWPGLSDQPQRHHLRHLVAGGCRRAGGLGAQRGDLRCHGQGGAVGRWRGGGGQPGPYRRARRRLRGAVGRAGAQRWHDQRACWRRRAGGGGQGDAVARPRFAGAGDGRRADAARDGRQQRADRRAGRSGIADRGGDRQPAQRGGEQQRADRGDQPDRA